MPADTLAAAAARILATASPVDKCALTARAVEAWTEGALPPGTAMAHLPERPARPDRPALLPPGQMPRRRVGSGTKGRIALLHAIAHIELNAVDLAWDLLARFAAPGLPRGFYDDWVQVAADEAHHFALLTGRLAALGITYGDLPAHDGMWDAAHATREDLAARLAVVPLVLEARGLDVTPGMIARLRQAGDGDSAAILETIYHDEIGHVRAGGRWFRFACAARGLEPVAAWRRFVERGFGGTLKPPFNDEAREASGLPADWYRPMSAA